MTREIKRKRFSEGQKKMASAGSLDSFDKVVEETIRMQVR
jgi:hypothetical protein